MGEPGFIQLLARDVAFTMHVPQCAQAWGPTYVNTHMLGLATEGCTCCYLVILLYY